MSWDSRHVGDFSMQKKKKVEKCSHFILREEGAGGELSAHRREGFSAVSEVVQQLSSSVFSVLLA